MYGPGGGIRLNAVGTVLQGALLFSNPLPYFVYYREQFYCLLLCFLITLQTAAQSLRQPCLCSSVLVLE